MRWDDSGYYIFGAKQSVKRQACFACTIKCESWNRRPIISYCGGFHDFFVFVHDGVGLTYSLNRTDVV